MTMHPLDPTLELARDAARVVANLSTAAKDRALEALAAALEARAPAILAANAADVADATALAPAMVDRLTLTPSRLAGVVAAVRRVIGLPDPVGRVLEERRRPNGLEVRRVRVPLGVIGFVYESRPDATVEAASLCLKSGNAVVLRGGREARRSNAALGEAIAEALRAAGLPPGAVQVLADSPRSYVERLLTAVGLVDLVIPRGGEALIRFVQETARVPVLLHAKGNCHVYLHADADVEKASRIAVNAKAQRPGVCNAAETLLVDAAGAERLLRPVLDALVAAGVELRGCERVRALYPAALVAEEADWDREYLAPIFAVKVVDGLDGALAHIARHGSQHTEAIVAESPEALARFEREVDASCVALNASTRFNDGGELGLGAEIGISTTKLHAYGPMGLEELTSAKFVVRGDGHVRG